MNHGFGGYGAYLHPHGIRRSDDEEEEEELEDEIVYDRGDNYPLRVFRNSNNNNNSRSLGRRQEGEYGVSPTLPPREAHAERISAEAPPLASVAPCEEPAPERTSERPVASPPTSLPPQSSPFEVPHYGGPQRQRQQEGSRGLDRSMESPASGFSIDSAVVTMDRAVQVPSAFRASATRRTMWDVLADIKKRNAEAKEEEKRRVANLKDISIPELLQWRKQREEPHEHKDHGTRRDEAAAGAHQSPNAPLEATAVGPPAEAKRTLRDLLPPHLREEDRQRAAQLAVERREQLAKERAMAMSISDFSSSSSSSSSGGSDHEEAHARGAHHATEIEEGEADGACARDCAGKVVGRGRARAKGTVLALLRTPPPEAEDEEARGATRLGGGKGKAGGATGTQQQDGSQQPTRRKGRAAPAAGTAPPPRSVADLFHATEEHVASDTAAAAAGGGGGDGHVGRPSRSSAGSAGMRASDLVEQMLNKEDEKRHQEDERAGGRRERRSGRLMNTDPFDADQEGIAEVDDGVDGPLPPTQTSQHAARTKRLNELLEDSLTVDAVRAAQEQQAREKEGRLRAQQAQWLQYHQSLGASEAHGVAVEGRDELSITGLGIVGKPVNVCLTSLAGASSASSSSSASWMPWRRRESLSAAPASSFPFPHVDPSCEDCDKGDLALTTTIPRLLVHPQQHQNEGLMKGGARGVGGGGGLGAWKQVVDNPTAIRIVDYMRKQFDRWLIDSGRILREIDSKAEEQSQAQAAAAAALTATATTATSVVPSQEQWERRDRSDLSTIVSSALEPVTARESSNGGGANEEDSSAPAQALVHRRRAATLHGSGVEVKMRISFAESAFGVTRVVGDVEWMSPSVQRRCGLLHVDDDATTDTDHAGGIEKAAAPSLSDLLFARKPSLHALEARRWTVAMPEHLFRSLPFAPGHCLYLAEPLYVYPAWKTILASYCVTTDLYVRKACLAYTGLLHTLNVASGGRAGNVQGRENRHSDKELPLRTHPGDEGRGGIGGFGDSGTFPTNEGGKGTGASGAEEGLPDYRTPVPQRRRRRQRSGSSGDGGGSDDEHRDNKTVLDVSPLSAGGARTPFRGNLYDPLAFPGIAMGGNNDGYSYGHGATPSRGEDEEAKDEGMTLANATPTASAGAQHRGGGGAGDRGEAEAERGERGGVAASERHGPPLYPSQPALGVYPFQVRDSNGNVVALSQRDGVVSQGRQDLARRREEEEAVAAAAAIKARARIDERDPMGIGYTRGPGAGWHVPCDVLQFFVDRTTTRKGDAAVVATATETVEQRHARQRTMTVPSHLGSATGSRDAVHEAVPSHPTSIRSINSSFMTQEGPLFREEEQFATAISSLSSSLFAEEEDEGNGEGTGRLNATPPPPPPPPPPFFEDVLL